MTTEQAAAAQRRVALEADFFLSLTVTLNSAFPGRRNSVMLKNGQTLTYRRQSGAFKT
jgi:hypothetical protein